MEIVAIASPVKLEIFMLIASGVALGGIAVGSFFWAVRRINHDWPNDTRGTAMLLVAFVVVMAIAFLAVGILGSREPSARKAAIEEARDFFWSGE